MNQYISFDGDKVGAKLELLITLEDIEKMATFSKAISKATKNLEDILLTNGYKVIFSGGDNILCFGKNDLDFFRELQKFFYDATLITASIGIGSSVRKSFLALKYAKASGGAKIIEFSKECNHE